ncbi:MAG TPA: YkgJ family cysteine cluster protein [Desulfobulbus sp.]|nr:YkgJ family cysteine cluster protein [Desulfobulbus sp.]
MSSTPGQAELNSLFMECRQCGTCCKKYRKILLHPSEVEFIRKMGGHVGVDVALNDLRENTMDTLVEEARAEGKVYMIHPDDRGCVFLEKRNEQYFCKIYHHRPRVCKGFRCNMADSSMLDLVAGDAIHLLGQNSFGLPLK